MLTNLIEQIERIVLHMEPHRAVRFLNASPAWSLPKIQRGRFRRTLRLAAERSPFYREQFRKRGIDVRRIEHPSELGDFYTTGEDLRVHGAEAFLTGRADTAFETTGTTSPTPKRVFFSQRELNEMGRTSAIGLYHLGMRAEDRVLSAYDCSFWVSPAVLRMGLQYLHCFHVEAGKISPEEFYEHAVVYKPNVIFGEPSWLLRLSELANDRGTWPMKLLFGGGENITEEARQVVEESGARRSISATARPNRSARSARNASARTVITATISSSSSRRLRPMLRDTASLSIRHSCEM